MRKGIYHAELNISSSVVDLATPLAAARLLHSGVNRCIVNVLTNPVRYTLDGTAPTSTLGLQIPANGSVTLYGSQMDAFKAIRESADGQGELAFFAD